MKAVKDNKVYTIDKTDDNFNVIEHSPLATMPYSEYAKIKAELEELKAKQQKK